MALTLAQINTLVILERISASISVLSTTILLVSFWTFKDFRSLSNILIFYASFANLVTSAAALMGRSAIHNPNGGLCQLQGFLLEMSMQSDALWACAMAINVYLCFFRRFDQVQLKKLHWVYGILCYGIPFIPAMFCLFYQDSRGKIYGDATLWCWINAKYAELRIYTDYLIVWITIAISLSIYFRVGIVIYKVRAQIRAFEDSSNHTSNPPATTVGRRMSSPVRQQHAIIAEPKPSSQFDGSVRIDRTLEVEYEMEMSRSDASGTTSYFNEPRPWDDNPPPSSPHSHLITTFSQAHMHTPRRPSALSICSKSPITTSISSPAPISPRRPHNNQMDRLKWAYTKSALLFTISILITWVPASANRVHGLTHPNRPNFTLSAMSACLLPLQGFWNTVIFFTSSWAVFKRLWRRWRSRVAADLERGRTAAAARAAVVAGKSGTRESTEENGTEQEEERRSSSGNTLVGQDGQDGDRVLHS